MPALNALNERLRDDFIADVEKGLSRWNKIIESHGVDFRLTLPHRGFNRRIGVFSDVHVSPDGKLVDEQTWQRMASEWLPTGEDKAYVAGLMSQPVHDPGKFANWIAPPARGINNQPIDFAYVRFD